MLRQFASTNCISDTFLCYSFLHNIYIILEHIEKEWTVWKT